MHLSIDQILLNTVKRLKFHLLFWFALITYEIPLAGMLSGRWGNPWDYLLHYILYIFLFYFHAHFALRKFSNGIFINVCLIFSEFVSSYIFNVAIYVLLKGFGVITIVQSPSSLLFVLASTYRFSFIILLSTSFWYMNSRIKKIKIISNQKETLNLQMLENEVLKASSLAEQLGRLKAIINPHFLLNTLNIIYHQLRKKSKVEATHILNLSEMMKYNLSPINPNHKINLSQEIDYIKSYLALRNLEKQYAIHVTFNYNESEIENEFIIPLVLPTLVENIFQHGDLNDINEPAFLKVKIHQSKLRIFISNKIKSKVHKGHGIGVDNLLNRLSFFYPNSYTYKSYRYRKRYFQKLYVNF